MTIEALAPAYVEDELPRVLMLEDPEPDSPFNDEFTSALRKGGFEVESVSNVGECLDRLDSGSVVVLGSLSLGMRWTDVCRRIRALSDVPIVIATPFESEIEAVLAFELGVAAYVTDRRHARELVARVRAALRPLRATFDSDSESESTRDSGILICSDLQIDLGRREVKAKGRAIYLARREFDLLAVLLSPPETVRTRVELVDRVWGAKQRKGSRTLDTHIRRLRLKLEDDPTEPRMLVTVRGVGFRFDTGL